MFTFFRQPDRGAKRPRDKDEDGGAAGGDEEPRGGGKQLKGLSVRELARYREAAGGGGAGLEGGGDLREGEELPVDKRKILEKLMDQDEEEPEVGHMMSVVITGNNDPNMRRLLFSVHV